MESTWIASPPPKPSLAELRRVISTEPVKVTLTFTPGIYPRVSVVVAMASGRYSSLVFRIRGMSEGFCFLRVENANHLQRSWSRGGPFLYLFS